MSLGLPDRRVSTGGDSSSYSRSDTGFASIPHSDSGGPLDQQGHNGTIISGTTQISGLTSPTAQGSQYANTKSLSSSCNGDPKHSESEPSSGWPKMRTTFQTPEASSASVPSGPWRAPWTRHFNRLKKVDRSQQGSKSEMGPDSTTQARLELLGYRQELYRTWDFWSLFSLSFCNVAILPGAFGSVSASYMLSGPIMLTVGMSITAIFIALLSASFGEMASAYPVAGAMFTWTFKLARANPHLREWARFISWVVGFLLFLSHLSVQLIIGIEFAQTFETIFTASGVHWHVTRHANLFVVLGFISITGLLSCTTLSRSPLVWKIIGLLVVTLQLSVCMALLATSKKQRSFASLFKSTPSKYASKSKAWNILYSWSVVTFVSGSETISHMTEESKNGAKTPPRAMFWSYVFTGFMQVLCCVCVGMAITPIHPKITGYPIIDAVFAHCPKPVAQFISLSLVITTFIANISQFFATSRFFWALARDKALPMSKIWRKVTPDRRPLRATFLMMTLSMIFSLLALYPKSRFVAVSGVANVFFISAAYATPLILYVFSEKDVYNRDGSNAWTLGRLSKPMACISIFFLTLQMAIHCTPLGWPVTPRTFPYPPFFLVGAVLISVVFWFLYGRSHYAGPIKSLTTWTLGYEVEIPKQVPNVQVCKAKISNLDPPRTIDSTPNGSAANMTYRRTEFELPQAFCTYDSSGSLWSATESQLPNQSFFH
ncbi:hypothetical protein PCANC_18609 [Puccinia coronata f. sp. avenae]|uniref:Amino acid permease/ SLC12A domain-containing protein n=1 Tax=Puccinia coronata f. sp. avenae TaxID=200324 RepID=A0A2N5UHT0_9BASI|nr:hypothetical protein PCASD_20029 [Puccinia coronata f. sp. avenae]PLW37247.1 hypothetical protein PCANC_18609 [Puccinia coronata f. sp. avenae]